MAETAKQKAASPDPPAEAKPIVVSHRPMLKDSATEKSDTETKPPATSATSLPSDKIKLAPIAPPSDETPAVATPSEPKPSETSTEIPETSEAESNVAKAAKSEPTEEDLKKEAERSAELQKLIDDQTYFLPINQVEKRRDKRNVILGAVFIVILGLAWADVALDSGILSIPGVKAPTHFFK